jgi:hypothetical protein
MKFINRAGYPFITLGIAFLALGATGKNAFLALGVVFLVIGAVFLTRK